MSFLPLVPASTYYMHFSRQNLRTLTKIFFMLLFKNVYSFHIPQPQKRISVLDTKYLSWTSVIFGGKVVPSILSTERKLKPQEQPYLDYK